MHVSIPRSLCARRRKARSTFGKRCAVTSSRDTVRAHERTVQPWLGALSFVAVRKEAFQVPEFSFRQDPGLNVSGPLTSPHTIQFPSSLSVIPPAGCQGLQDGSMRALAWSDPARWDDCQPSQIRWLETKTDRQTASQTNRPERVREGRSLSRG